MDNNKIGVITEQGDLGLGFNPLTDDEEETIEENFNKQTSKEDN